MDLFAPKHLIIILVVVLLVFGTKKLSTFGSDLGGAIRGFKKAMNDPQADATPPAAAPAAAEAAPRIATAPAEGVHAPATDKTHQA